jgi:hypothetical protein
VFQKEEFVAPEGVKKAPFKNRSPDDVQFQVFADPKSLPPSSMRIVTCNVCFMDSSAMDPKLVVIIRLLQQRKNRALSWKRI